MRPSLWLALTLAGLAGGCTSDDYVRTEGVTTGAGNAQASNTVMQMVDPWRYGVQDTKLLVPAQQGAAAAAASPAAGAKGGAQTTGSTTSD
jgi:hypothetical protein